MPERVGLLELVPMSCCGVKSVLIISARFLAVPLPLLDQPDMKERLGDTARILLIFTGRQRTSEQAQRLLIPVFTGMQCTKMVRTTDQVVGAGYQLSTTCRLGHPARSLCLVDGLMVAYIAVKGILNEHESACQS